MHCSTTSIHATDLSIATWPSQGLPIEVQLLLRLKVMPFSVQVVTIGIKLRTIDHFFTLRSSSHALFHYANTCHSLLRAVVTYSAQIVMIEIDLLSIITFF